MPYTVKITEHDHIIVDCGWGWSYIDAIEIAREFCRCFSANSVTWNHNGVFIQVNSNGRVSFPKGDD